MKTRTINIIGSDSLNIRIMGDGTARYHYWLDEDGADFCTFSLFCQIGKPFQPAFEKLMADNDIEIIGQKEYEGKPYYADAVRVPA